MGTTRRALWLLGSLMAVACNGSKTEASSATAEAKAADAVPTPPKVNIDPYKTAQAEAAKKPMVRAQTGHFDLSVDGTMHHLRHLPFGENKALWYEGKRGVISVTASDDGGYPRMKIVMTGWRLDQLELPITLSGEDKQSLVTFRYEVGPKGPYKSDNAATLTGANKVTLTKFQGDRLEGSFEATVAADIDTLGPPLKVSGEFATTLRLDGVQPSDAKAAPQDGGTPGPGDGTATPEPAPGG